MVVRKGPPIARGAALGVEESSESVGIGGRDDGRDEER
jgi:hypothetical protein